MAVELFCVFYKWQHRDLAFMTILGFGESQLRANRNAGLPESDETCNAATVLGKYSLRFHLHSLADACSDDEETTGTGITYLVQ